MYKIYLSLVCIALSFMSHAQNVTVNPTTVSYATLKEAFDAINLGTHTGAVTIEIINSTTEPVGGATLEASGTGGAFYTSVSIQPFGGTSKTITAAITAGGSLIILNGADNVTINGLNTDGNSLTLSNTTAASTVGTSTIRFQADASDNTITNCSVLGSSTTNSGTLGGNIIFTSSAIVTGNDNNTISNCDIGPAGSTTPSKAIFSVGTSNIHPGTANSGIVISGNNIFDYFTPSSSSAGIDIQTGTVGTTIANNKFYQTATRTNTFGSLSHFAIRINNSGGNGFQITGNTIGFASSTGTGIYTLVVTSASQVIGISLSVGSTTASSVQGNSIAGIAVSGNSSGLNSAAVFRGIYVSSGLTTIGDVAGNNVGSQSAPGSITYSSSSGVSGDLIGIHSISTANWVTNNNTIGGIRFTNSSTGSAHIYGLRCATASNLTWIANNNIVGGTVANSIQSINSSGSNLVNGILNSAANGTISGNIVRNLTSSNGLGTSTSASVIGISVTAISANHTISQNTIYNLSNSNTALGTVVTGIQFNSSTGANFVQRNLLYDFSNASSSTSAEVNGIKISGGTTTYRNNMIRLGTPILNAFGTSPSTGGINGINELSGTNNFYHNSIEISGAPTSGVGPSYAFNSSTTTVTRAVRNNIFVNTRSNEGSTGSNYIIKMAGTSANPPGLTINNNVFHNNSGTGEVFGYFNSAAVADLGAWIAAIGQDDASLFADPLFVSATNLHLQATSPAIDIAPFLSIVDDFDGETRPGLNTAYDIGSDEQDGFNAIALPIGLLSFSGRKDGAVNQLRWTTGTEQNNKGFEVQRSSDGFGYLAIGFVNSNTASGNSSVELLYNFTDNNPPGGKQFYRLRQLDLDNQSKLSRIITISGNRSPLLAIAALFPNPAGSQLNVLIDVPARQKLTLVILDLTGRRLIQRSVNVEVGTNSIVVNISKLTKGTYLVKFICDYNCDVPPAKFIRQ